MIFKYVFTLAAPFEISDCVLYKKNYRKLLKMQINCTVYCNKTQRYHHKGISEEYICHCNHWCKERLLLDKIVKYKHISEKNVIAQNNENSIDWDKTCTIDFVLCLHQRCLHHVVPANKHVCFIFGIDYYLDAEYI